MKKKLIATMLAGTMLTTAAMPAHAASPAANPLDGYSVTVCDQTAPCVFAAGKDWPITTWYFFDADHNIIGSIPNSAVMEIARTAPIIPVSIPALSVRFLPHRPMCARSQALQFTSILHYNAPRFDKI